MASPPLNLPSNRVKGRCLPVAPSLPAAQAETLALLFKALAALSRCSIWTRVGSASEPICACDLGQPTVSRHFTRLKQADLVARFKRGIWSFSRLRQDPSAAAQAALALTP